MLWFLMSVVSVPVYADTSISVSFDSNAVVLDVLPNKTNGSFAKSSSLTVDVGITGPGGYTVSVSSTGSTDLVKQGDSTKKFTSITSAVSEADFSANNATAGENYNMKWGYLPSKFDSAVNSLYRPAPGEEGDILDVTHGTNDEGEYEIAIGARASMGTDAGAYTNTFVITAVSNYSCSVGDVCYYGNEEDAGAMGNQTIPAGATEVVLNGLNYRRDGYGFAGWSTTLLDPDDTNFASDFANATVYGPMETVEIPVSGYLGLYAVWVPSAGDMQAWDGCGAMNIGDVIALTDTRDGNTYAVAKLVDGNCWMIENLRLGSSNSDNSIGALSQGYGTSATYGDFSGLADAESSNFYDSTVANSLYYSGTQSGNASINIGTTDYPGYRMPRYSNRNTPANVENRPQNPETNGYNMFSYGNYYTWAAAIADLTHYNTNSVTNTSLCPSGWRLPQGGNKNRIESDGDNDFWNLIVIGLNNEVLPDNYNSYHRPYYSGVTESSSLDSVLRSYPNNFLYSGNFNRNSVESKGASGFYWSSTAADDSYVLSMTMKNDRVAPGTGLGYKYNGYVIRCMVDAGT